jgi:hypothetical protein
VLPDAFTHGTERLARFKREAQVLDSLNHPNIAAIYGVEDSGSTHALVLVDGPTLADRLARTPIPVDEALPIARQIADRHVPDASPIVSEERQDEQEAVGCSWDHEEIGRHDLADVIPQEGAPDLRGRLAPAPHVCRDGRLTHINSEFQQFAVNPRRAPPRAAVSITRSGACCSRPSRR